MKYFANLRLKTWILVTLFTLTFLNVISLVGLNALYGSEEGKLWFYIPVLLLNLGFFYGAYLLLSRLLLNPIQDMGEKAKAMAHGDYEQTVTYTYDNELSVFSTALNNLFDKFRTTSHFVKELGKGNVAFEWEDANDDARYKDDPFVQSLLETRNTLQKNEKANAERNWATEGVAKLEGVLRQHNHDLSELSSVVITFLIKYLKANQGAIFLLREEEKEQVLELTASYAYGRKKFIDKVLKPGEGLVGQAMLEKEVIYLTEVPQNYTHITSGLGEATPTAIIIMPLKVEEKVVGVVEIASFNILEPYQQEFLQKAGQSIGSSIMNANINIKTSHLLQKSQQQTEELRAQEEEMRQNMEEMEATQEEMRRVSSELETEKSKLSDAMRIASMANWEIDLRNEEFMVNDNFYGLLETSASEEGGYTVKVEQIVSKYFYVDADNVQQAIGKVVSKADPKHEETLVHKAMTKAGREIFLTVTLKALFDSKGQVSGLYGVCRDVTNEVKLEQERSSQMEEMMAQEEELRQNMEEMEAVQEEMSRVGRELEAEKSKLSDAMRIASMANWEIDLRTNEFMVNDNFYELLGTTAGEEGGYTVKVEQIVSKYFYVDADNVQQAIGKVVAREDAAYEEILVHKALTKTGEEIFLSVVLKALLSEEGKVTGLYGVCREVTKEIKAKQKEK